MNALALLILTMQAPGESQDWIQLFNGRDLTGWTAKLTHHELGDNHAQTFRVEDGLLKVRYDRYTDGFKTRFGHLFYEKPYSYYRLRVEYRFVGEQAAQGPGAWAIRNSGIMFHSQPPQTIMKEQTFPISIEAQFLGGLSDGNRHTHEDLPVLLVGRGGGFQLGRHVVYPKNMPMTNLYLTLLDRMGVQAEKLGDSTGEIDQLTGI